MEFTLRLSCLISDGCRCLKTLQEIKKIKESIPFLKCLQIPNRIYLVLTLDIKPKSTSLSYCFYFFIIHEYQD